MIHKLKYVGINLSVSDKVILDQHQFLCLKLAAAMGNTFHTLAPKLVFVDVPVQVFS